MTWKRIVVHVRSYQEWSASIDVAMELAKRFDAKLTGLYTIRELAMLKLVLGANSQSVRDAEARDAPLTAKAQARFLEACEKAGVKAEWQVGEGNAAELLNLVGRCHNLVVVEQSTTGLEGLGTDVVEECAISCGTPTLIVPRSGYRGSIGKRVVIAWNHSRQSAAALRGAIPLIATAERVTVLIGKERDPMSSVTRRPEHDIGPYLRAYASNVDVVPFGAGDAEAGSKLLSTVRSMDGDLLVMGAYGRSAFREFLFGGATRHIITKLDVPVLMAH